MKSPFLLTTLAILVTLGAGAAFTQPAPSPATAEPAHGAPVITTQASGANLNISPKRVTFDRGHRSATVFIFNQGSAAGTFDISLVDRVMLPDGQILPLADAEAKPDAKPFADRLQSAQQILQISPRRVTLNPGQGQTIRLRVTGAPVDPGVVELRSHLTIATLPPRETGTTAEAAAADRPSNQHSFQISALLGLSIPAIVRMGDPDIRAQIENAHVTFETLNGPNNPPTPTLTLELVRTGANSLFGNFEIRSAGQPRSPVLGASRGVGVYTEIDRRSIRIPLTRALAQGEHLEVTFTDDDTSPGKVLAKLTL